MEQRWLRLPRVCPRKGTTFDTCMRFHLKGPMQTKNGPLLSTTLPLPQTHNTTTTHTRSKEYCWSSRGLSTAAVKVCRNDLPPYCMTDDGCRKHNSFSFKTHTHTLTHSAVLAAFRTTNYRELAFPACPGNKLNEDGFLARSCQVSRSRLMEAHSTRQGRFTSFGQKHHHHLTTSPNLSTIDQTNLPPCFMTSGGCITSDAYLPIGVMHPTG